MDAVLTWIQSNKGISWFVFWAGWFYISPETIIPASIAFGVGYSFYKERAVNVVTICAAYLGIRAYLLLAHAVTNWPENVRLWMGFGMIFALIVLGKHYRMFGYILLGLIMAAISGGRSGGRRRW